MQVFIYLVHIQIASRSGLNAKDIELILNSHVAQYARMKNTKEKLTFQRTMTRVKTAESLDMDHDYVASQLTNVLHSSYAMRVWLLFRNKNPVLNLEHYSLVVSHGIKVSQSNGEVEWRHDSTQGYNKLFKHCVKKDS